MVRAIINSKRVAFETKISFNVDTVSVTAFSGKGLTMGSDGETYNYFKAREGLSISLAVETAYGLEQGSESSWQEVGFYVIHSVLMIPETDNGLEMYVIRMKYDYSKFSNKESQGWINQ